MSGLAACRLCLSGNVKINSSIRNTKLQGVFERLTSFKLFTGDGRPDTVCHVCHWQLHRFAAFCDKSKQSGDILTEVYRNGIEITPETVSVLNRAVQSSYCVASLGATSYTAHNAVKKENPEPDDGAQLAIEYKNPVIKCEAVLCRVCLAVDLRTCTLRHTSLQHVYERLTSTKLEDEDGRPETVCFLCAAQLHRARKLYDKAQRSESVLAELIHNGVQLTQDIVSTLNRGAKPSCARSAVEVLSYVPDDLGGVPVKEELVGMEEDALIATDSYEIKIETSLENMKMEPIDYSELTEHSTDKIINSHQRTCDTCKYRCTTDAGLKKHLRFHNLNRRHVCSICTYRFAKQSQLTQHISNVHRYRCAECKRTFQNSISYKRHKLTHTSKRFHCEKCASGFDTANSLRSHYYNVHKGERHPCSRCEFTSTSYAWLLDHIIRIHTRSNHYICDICHRTCSTKKSLKHHLSLHFITKRPECGICFKTFSTQQNLLCHNTLHTGDRPFKCELCSKSYSEKARLTRHSFSHNEREFSCTVCHKGFFRRDLLRRHMIVHTGEKIHECEHCDLKFLTSIYMRKHMATHTEERPHECGVCSKMFKTTAGLKLHTSLHGKLKTYICDYCKKAFTGKNYLAMHMIYHRQKRYNCDICDQLFHSKQILELHKRTHTGEKPFECNDCGHTFTQKCALKRHIRAHNKDKPFRCRKCKKSFAEKLSLRRHNLYHHDRIDRFVCDLCNSVFIDKEKLELHIRTHEKKPENYSCHLCGKSFFKLSTLTQHARRHYGVNRCAFCDKEFDNKTNLHRHNVSSHQAVLRYGCNICEEPFEALNWLNAHIRKHTGEKPFACELCDKTYVERRDLLHHMRTIHDRLECFN